MKCLKIWRGDDVLLSFQRASYSDKAWTEIKELLHGVISDFYAHHDHSQSDFTLDLDDLEYIIDKYRRGKIELRLVNAFLRRFGINVTFEQYRW